MSDVFISYARSTGKQAQAVTQALRDLGYSVWIDDDLPAHRAYSRVIEEQLTAAKAAVVIWSPDAVRSEWVLSEANRAREQQKLVQVVVDAAQLPMPFDTIQCADLTGWSGDVTKPSWRKVVASLLELTGGTPASLTPPIRNHSVCVLPFTNMSGDAEQEYFSDGISEDIITDLSKVSALTVTSRNSAFRYKGQSVDLPKLARELGVGHVLEGSVRKAGGRVRITAQLINGATNDSVWAERYDRDLTDIFALQDEISEAIVEALKLRLAPEEKAAIEHRGTSDVQAYNLYLQARQAYVRENDRVRDHVVIKLCREAVEIDPGYAKAWSLMALAQAWSDDSVGAFEDDGMAAAERALRLDDKLSDAHAAKARLLHARGLHDEADREIQVAIALDPASYEANETAGLIAYRVGRTTEAVSYFEKAASVMDGGYYAPGMLTCCYAAVGDEDGLKRAARQTIKHVEAFLATDQSNGGALGFLVIAYAALGEGDWARAWIARALKIDPENIGMRYNFACALSRHLYDRDGAIEILGPFFERIASGFLEHAKTDPDLDLARTDLRFAEMVRKAEERLAGEHH